MGIRAYYEVHCDGPPIEDEYGCGDWYAEGFLSKKEAESEAKKKGWRRVKLPDETGFSWLCPRCSKKLDKP